MYIDFTYEPSNNKNKQPIVYCIFCGGTKLHHGQDDSCIGKGTHAYESVVVLPREYKIPNNVFESRLVKCYSNVNRTRG